MRQLTIVAVLALCAAILASEPTSAARVYAGQPSGAAEAQLVFSLSNSANRLTRLTFHFDVSCASSDFRTVDFGTPLLVDDLPDELRVGEHYLVGARVARGGRLSGTLIGVDLVGENVEYMNVTLSGIVGKSRARGRLAMKYVRNDLSTGDVTAQCAKNIQWRARRSPGVVYAGATSQDEPVVLELVRGRRRVSHAHLSWFGPCQGGGAWTDRHDEFDLRPFNLSPSGAFSRTYRFAFSDGSVVERFAGRVTRTRASGTFQGDATITTAGGADICSSGRVSWSARTG